MGGVSRGARRLGGFAPALLPVGAYALLGLWGGAGPEGRFRAGVGALVLAAALGAFVSGTGGRRLAVLLISAALVGGAVGLGGGSPAAVAAGLALVLSVALAAAGAAALGRRIGAGAAGSGATALGLMLVALTALAWADPLAERLPLPRRWAFVEAVLQVDPASAWAYDVAAYDRLREPEVYATVPLASSTHARPAAGGAALAWGAFGLLLGLAAGLRRDRIPRSPFAGNA